MLNPIYPEDQYLTVPEALKIFFVKVDCISVRGRPIIGADIKHFTDIGHFQNRFADNFFFFYANKHTIYRGHYLLVNK